MSEQFTGQKAKEKHIKTFRKSFTSLIKKAFIFAVLFLTALFFIIYLSQLQFLSFISNYINIAGLLALIFSLSYGFYTWLTWYYNVYVLTDERIIEVHQKGIFNREVKEIDLSKVGDITYSVSGILSTVAETGNVSIKSSSGMLIEMENVGKPSLVRELIMKLVEKKGKSKKDLSTEALAEELLRRMQK